MLNVDKDSNLIPFLSLSDYSYYPVYDYTVHPSYG